MILDFKKIQKEHKLDIKGIIHIGAHYGQEYEFYKTLGVKDLLFFEPIPECYEITKKNVKGIVINKALGNFNGKAKMYISSNRGVSSSLLKPKLHKTQYRKITFNKTIEIEVARLDDILKDSKQYNFISIDVQGYELEVFKGAVNTLKNINYIMTEVNRAELYEGCVQVDELDNFLTDFDRVETNWIGKTWGDAFYIR